MRNLELLIDKSRKLSGNQRYDANSGIPQDVFVQYFQNAQDYLVKAIFESKTKYFLKTSVVSVVNNQEEYDYPEDLYLRAIDTMEWSDDQQSWLFLEMNLVKDRTTSISGYPYGYVTKNSSYILSPPLQSGYIRLSYMKAPNRLEKKSGLVVSTTGTPITSITLDGTFAGHDPTYLNEFKFLTICDKFGQPKVNKLPITGVSGTTITVDSYTLGSGETIVAGDFVLADRYATNVTELPDVCESFLILHATYQAKYGDSSQWSKAVQDDVASQAQGIISNFGLLRDDIIHVPIVNTDFLSIW